MSVSTISRPGAPFRYAVHDLVELTSNSTENYHILLMAGTDDFREGELTSNFTENDHSLLMAGTNDI